MSDVVSQQVIEIHSHSSYVNAAAFYIISKERQNGKAKEKGKIKEEEKQQVLWLIIYGGTDSTICLHMMSEA